MIRWIFITSLLFIAQTLQAAADEPLRAYANDQSPWGFIDSRDRAQGAVVDFFRLLSVKLGHTVKTTVAPYQRIAKDLRTGDADLSIFPADQKPKGVIPVAKVMDLNIIAVVRKDVALDSVKSLHGLKLAHVRGTTYHQHAWAKGVQSEFIAFNSYTQALEALEKGRLHGVIGTSLGIVNGVMALGLTEKILSSQKLTLYSQPAWLYMSSVSPHQDKKTAIKAAVQAMVNAGELSAAAQKYLKARAKLNP